MQQVPPLAADVLRELNQAGPRINRQVKTYKSFQSRHVSSR
jgi:hypothetical protein